MNAIAAAGHLKVQAAAAGEPELQIRVRRIIKRSSVQQRHGAARGILRARILADEQFFLRRGLQHRIAREFLRRMKSALQIGLLDEEVIHEQLPPDVDGDHFRRIRQIRHLHGLYRHHIAIARRPDLRKHDAVVKCPITAGGGGEDGSAKQGRHDHEMKRSAQEHDAMKRRP